MTLTPEQNRAHVHAWLAIPGNKERAAKRARDWRKANPERARALNASSKAKRKAEDPELYAYRQRAKLLKKYGLTPEQWDVLFESQGCACLICGSTESGDGRWHTDHDPSVGYHAVRGILCVRCNIGIGQFLHRVERLEAAIAYLRRNK